MRASNGKNDAPFRKNVPNYQVRDLIDQRPAASEVAINAPRPADNERINLLSVILEANNTPSTLPADAHAPSLAYSSPPTHLVSIQSVHITKENIIVEIPRQSSNWLVVCR